MVILAYGVEQPTTGDPGNIFFPILERLCQKFAVHDHNGVNTAIISSGAVPISSTLAPTSGWVNVSPGIWEQTISLPPSITYDSSLFECREEATKEVVYCDVVKVTNTTLKIRAIFNDLAIRVYFK